MVAIFKKLDLDLSRIPSGRVNSAKRAVLNVIENETSRAVAKGRSPVKGEFFPKLNKEYAEDFKQGDRTPNLQFDGDMLEAIEYTVLQGSEIGWGYSDKNAQSDKADGHNQFSAKSKKAIWANGNPKLERRRFIPDVNQDLKPSTMRLVNEELDKFRTQNESTEFALELNTSNEEEITAIDIGGNLFSDETIISELLREFANGQS